MPRYIDADELGERLEKMLETSVKMDYFNEALIESLRSPSRTIGLQDALRALETQPTADVEPVQHGRWINVIGDDYECSNCKAAVWARKANPIRKYKYCWSCGAKMDGDADDS